MSTETIVKLRDDLDGSDASLTIAFAMEGKSYEIDLNDVHADEMRKALQRYVDVARRTSGVTSGTRRRRVSSSGSQQSPSLAATQSVASSIREWAHSNNIAVNDRGRIPEAIVQAYDEAQGGQPVADAETGATPAKETTAAKKPAKKAAAKKVKMVEMSPA